MTTTATTALLLRCIGEARRRREAIIRRKERDRVPRWVEEPLRLAGLSAGEIAELTGDRQDLDQHAAALDEVRHELARWDTEIERLEDEVLKAPCTSLEEIQAGLELVLGHLRSWAADSASDLGRYRDSSRVMALLDAAADGMRGLMTADLRLAS